MLQSEIGQRFVNYYQALGYQLLPRAPMLDSSIPMSFVMSAGLVQVEKMLVELSISGGERFVLVQDCFRHFDLAKIGSDDIHLSFFEMPGAFVFGAENRQETISKMWTLVSSILGINTDCIWASYFGGNNYFGNSLGEDEAALEAWLNVGLPRNRIVGLSSNFWLQGGGLMIENTIRKCGPNTELFFDLGEKRACGKDCRPGCNCGRFVEFSNSLFISYGVDPANNDLKPLRVPFTETVIGTERVEMIIEAVNSVFDTEDLRTLVNIIQNFSESNQLEDSTINTSVRVIADHVRALYFLVADGAPPPGKDGRSRIMRQLIRGIIFRQIVLGITSESFLHSVVDAISNTLPMNVPEYCTKDQTKDRFISYYYAELERFNRSIAGGQRQLKRILGINNGLPPSGEQILYLEKQHGFPHQLTKVWLQQHQLPFYESEYEEALSAWRRTFKFEY